jgi:hypothetical protein
MSKYVEVKDGVVLSGPWDYTDSKPDMSAVGMETIDVTNESPMPRDRWTYSNGVFTEEVVVLPLVSLAELRLQRDELLQITDWKILPDSPLSEAETLLWADYRQELRDITEGYTPVADPVWPVAPI